MSLSFPLYLNPSFCCNYQFVPPKSCSSSIRKSGEGGSSSSRAGSMKEASAVCYKKFIDFALEETKVHTHLATSPLQKKFNSLMSMDARTELQMLSFEAPKVRLLRCLSIEGNDGMQVLDFAVFPKPEFDLPIFCANFFTAASTNIVVLDLNPLHAVTDRDDYKEKYYRHLIPLGLKYAELLPWGGKITSESLRFFSPIVIWTKFSSSQYYYDVLFSAFKDYYKAWLELMEQATEEIDTSEIVSNREAQHRYLMWRAEKLAVLIIMAFLTKKIAKEENTEKYSSIYQKHIRKAESFELLFMGNNLKEYDPFNRWANGSVATREGLKSLLGV
nr:phytochromobilin:ferredoxin oxidoreductase, chloroplastic-like [Coffea arabica]